MMSKVAFHIPLTTEYINDLHAETLQCSYTDPAKRFIVRVTAHGMVLADAYAATLDPEDEQILLDLVRVRGSV